MQIQGRRQILKNILECRKGIVTLYLRQQSTIVRGFLRQLPFQNGEKRVQDRHEYRVRFSAVSLNVDADLEAMRNSAFGVERQLKRHEFKYVRAVPGTKDSL